MRLAALVAVLLLAGCLQVVPYDPVTASQIERTIAFERADYQMSREALEALGAPDIALDSLDARHRSEMLRLEAWRLSEEAKKE